MVEHDDGLDTGFDISGQASGVIESCLKYGATISAAESLTGGLVCAALVDVPGASQVMCGGVVAYMAAAKVDQLNVNANQISQFGTVSPQIAAEMAYRCRHKFCSTWAVSTTGVAGPEPSEGHRPGTVHIAVAGPDTMVQRALMLTGSRIEIRTATVYTCLNLLLDTITEENPGWSC